MRFLILITSAAAHHAKRNHPRIMIIVIY